jgi:hypothetical protein
VNFAKQPIAKIEYFDRAAFSCFLLTLDFETRNLTTEAMVGILPRAWRLIEGKWFKQLQAPLMQFRIGPTTADVLAELGMPSSAFASRRALLVRVFFVFSGPARIVVLHAYDKTRDRTRLSQRREIAVALRNLEFWKEEKR